MSVKELQELAQKYDGRVADLLSLGRDKLARVTRYSYVEKFGFTQDDIPQLLLLANDMEIYEHDYADIAEDEGLEFFGVIHAWHVLSELEVPEAKAIFMEKLISYDDHDFDAIDEWMATDFTRLMKPFRKDMYPICKEILEEEKYSIWTRLEYIGLIKDMLKSKEVELSLVNALIINILSHQNDAIINAGIIGLCMDEELVEHHALIKACFARNAVDIDHIGDLEEVEMQMGLRTERETIKQPTEMQRRLQSITGNPIWDTIDDETLDFVTKRAKLGRNEPCHCGSGKKYKKCCLNK